MLDDNKLKLADLVIDMFMRYPAAKNTSKKQVEIYVMALSEWPVSVVDKAIVASRSDADHHPDFPPSVDRVEAKLRTIGMTPLERETRVALTDFTPTKRIQ